MDSESAKKAIIEFLESNNAGSVEELQITGLAIFQTTLLGRTFQLSG